MKFSQFLAESAQNKSVTVLNARAVIHWNSSDKLIDEFARLYVQGLRTLGDTGYDFKKRVYRDLINPFTEKVTLVKGKSIFDKDYRGMPDDHFEGEFSYNGSKFKISSDYNESKERSGGRHFPYRKRIAEYDHTITRITDI